MGTPLRVTSLLLLLLTWSGLAFDCTRFQGDLQNDEAALREVTSALSEDTGFDLR